MESIQHCANKTKYQVSKQDLFSTVVHWPCNASTFTKYRSLYVKFENIINIFEKYSFTENNKCPYLVCIGRY